MDLKRARDTIENVFSNEFDRETFIKFASNLLNSNFSQPSILQGNQIPEQFKDGINSLETLSNYVDSSQKKIDLLIVTLKADTALDRRRTMQRNFVARYLDNKFKDAALVAFVTPRKDNWRFSLIQIESRLEGVKVVDDYTPAKRWSFLLGKNEGCHTAKSQLLEILANDSEDPSLEELIEAFNIETVTKEFYQKYRELFDRMTENLKELIENDFEIEKDFREKQIKPRDFARKTMGQITFLYFLQKKGWFGVRAGEEWGTGVKNFVRKLFEKRETYGSNFFNDVLEPLFYEALAQDRGPGDIYIRLNNVRMPFLNGGLFEPLNGYSWETTNITLSDELFSNNNKTKEDDQGDGILDIFDRYNFTVNESEPLEVEVAVDPEMLGKVFENLIPENIRKGKGAYYTPRPIVHYMCQESLINYLDTELSHTVEKETIEAFIRNESSQLDLTDELKSNAQKIDDLLANIKVCDPAVGSGAFPLGLLTGIVKARVKIGEYIDSKYSIYDLKLQAISNSIYGVDIDPGAIEIAKLRFWLSLVVEQDAPSPLPNLDHKIMQGNSLISEYEGIRLFDDKLLENNESRYARIDQLEKIRDSEQKDLAILVRKGEYTSTSKADLEEKIKPIIKEIKSLKRKNIEESGDMLKQSSGLFDPEDNVNKKIAQNTARALNAKKAELISTHSQSEKERLKKQIEELTWRLIEITLQERGELDKLKEIKELRRQRIKPFFIWKLEFADVFKNKRGFDVIIGNPPYIKEYTEKSAFDGLRESPYYQGKMDLWYLFACNGLDILNDRAILSFIATNNWVTNFGASKMRSKVINDARILKLLDFNNFKIFDSAAIQTMIMMFQKDSISDNYEFDYRKLNNNADDLSNVEDLLAKKNNGIHEIFSPIISRKNFQNKPLIFTNSLISSVLNKIQKLDYFNLSNSEVAQGIVCPQDFLNKKNNEKLDNVYKVGDGVFVISHNEYQALNFTFEEKRILKPFFTSNELHRYFGDKNNNYWIIYTSSEFKNSKKILPYPNIKKHLDKFMDIITSHNKPYGLHRSRDESFFNNEKIISLRKCSKRPVFTYTDFDCYVSATFFSIRTSKINLIALTGFLNSSLCAFWLKFQGKMQGTNYQVDKEPLVNIPIPNSLGEFESTIIELVKKIIKIKSFNINDDTLHHEKEIDQLVYQLYDLTKEEIEIIENSIQ